MNGTSSSGKTSIAKAIQRLIGVPCMHASLDAFVDMFYWEAIRDSEQRKACHAFGVKTFHGALPLIIAGGHLVVVDHVFERQSWYDECIAAAKEAGILLVGVRCPLEVVEQRERTREDRMKGLARWQFNVVHESKPYHLEVDTSVLSPEACASVIVERLMSEI